MEEFVIDTISRLTLEEYGYDSSGVTDEMMERIAENLRYTFRECVLPNLSQIADEHEIPLRRKHAYIVNRRYLSLNDEDWNSNDSLLFYSKKKAQNQLKQWREDEMNLRKESACAYEIKTNEKNSFRLSWDDEKEWLFIGITAI